MTTDEPGEVTFRGRRVTVYTWRRAIFHRDGWQAAAAGRIVPAALMVGEWRYDRCALAFGGEFFFNRMRYW